jgi:hypothetical protein
MESDWIHGRGSCTGGLIEKSLVTWEEMVKESEKKKIGKEEEALQVGGVVV